MPGALPHYRQGPATYTAGGFILGGQLVSPTATSGAGASTVSVVPTGGPVSGTYPLGVAGSDANTLTEPIFPASQDPSGEPTGDDSLLDLGFVKSEVAVYNNVDIVVNYDNVGATNFGAKLTWSAATAGSVTVYTGSDPKAVIGFCSQPGGVAASSSGRAFISVA